ncbi:unnamed protein product [Polarella glacialis]|nr:unnamed protein product [Polarella glacialis]
MRSEVSGKWYIGVRMCPEGVGSPEDDIKYQSSSSDKAFRLQPKTKLILTRHSSRQPALQAERLLHLFYKVVASRYFVNRAYQTLTGFDRSGAQHSQESKDKISKARMGKMHTQDTKDKMSEARKGKPGKPHSQETKDKISEARTGKTHSQETKDKMSKSRKGKTHSQETKDKISQARKGMLGKPHSQETRDKMRQAHKGKKLTQVTKDKISEARKGRDCQRHSQERKDKISKSIKYWWERRRFTSEKLVEDRSEDRHVI